MMHGIAFVHVLCVRVRLSLLCVSVIDMICYVRASYAGELHCIMRSNRGARRPSRLYYITARRLMLHSTVM